MTGPTLNDVLMAVLIQYEAHGSDTTVWEVGLYSEAKATFRSKAKAEAFLAAAIAADAGNYEADWWWMGEVKVLDDDAADRLIEGLAGKAGEQ